MRAVLQMEEQGLHDEAVEYRQKLAYYLLGIPVDGEMPNTTTLAYQLLGMVVKNIPTSTPKQFRKKRQARGGKQVEYVEVGYIKQVLTSTFGIFWDFTRVGNAEYLTGPDHATDGRLGIVVVRGRLTVKIPTKTSPMGFIEVSKESVGEAEIQRFALVDRNGKPLPNGGKAVNMGDDEKAAESDALKRCASYFGIAADVYWGKDAVTAYDEAFN